MDSSRTAQRHDHYRPYVPHQVPYVPHQEPYVPHQEPQGTQHVRRPARYYDSDSESDSEEESSDDDARRGRRRSEGDRYSRRDSPSRDRRSRQSENYTVQKAVKSAAMAAGVEAFRCRQEPGPWSGQKGARVVTAAVGGVVLGALRNGRLKKEGKLPIAEAAVTGFYAVDFLKRVLRQTNYGEEVAESRPAEVEKKDHRRTRSRSRSRARPHTLRSSSIPRRRVEYGDYEDARSR